EVYVMVGDGSYLMLAQELVTAISEGIKLIVVLVQNHGFASIGGLSRSIGSGGFGTRYRYRDADRELAGDELPVDLAANAESLGASVLRAASIDELHEALKIARDAHRTTVIHVDADPEVSVPSYGSWWDVPVAEVSSSEAVRAARRDYEEARRRLRPYL
ncbi:MAG: thiamine pyrophosphate-dependent enzyme, partial [Actinomycetota bacterium]